MELQRKRHVGLGRLVMAKKNKRSHKVTKLENAVEIQAVKPVTVKLPRL
jgi:hypothetical protein